jgi:DNA-binding MarR family transcriptional regulator
MLVARTCACMHVRQASRAITRNYEEALRPVGLTATQFSVLVATSIAGPSGFSMAKLSDILVLDRTSLTRILKPMEKDGMVTLTASAEDARVRLVKLSAKGQQKFAAAMPLWNVAQAEFEARAGAAWAPIGKGLRELATTLAASP